MHDVTVPLAVANLYRERIPNCQYVELDAGTRRSWKYLMPLREPLRTSSESIEVRSMTFVNTRPTHRALVQLHRWYLLYEAPITKERIRQQLEILDPEVRIHATRGVARGHQEFIRGVESLAANENHSHHVLSSTIRPSPEGTIALEADMVYQHLKQDGSLSSAYLHYAATLREAGGDLPLFQELHIAFRGPADEAFAKYAPRYAENRALSFLHRWLSLLENIGGSAEFYRELLAPPDRLRLYFGADTDPPITNYTQLAAWLANVASTVAQSSHRISEVSVRDAGDGHYEVGLSCDWLGVDRAGSSHHARTRHEWTLHDTGERFCRLETARVR